jgi:hypothetical protein
VLECAHEQRIVDGELKPANIKVRNDGTHEPLGPPAQPHRQTGRLRRCGSG